MPVYEKINRVQAALAKQGIGKDHQNVQQNYKFRGVDDVYEALAPLLAEHKLVIMPQFEERQETTHTTSKGAIMAKTVVRGSFLFIDAEDGSTATACIFGEGSDSGDKSTNKAMSTAYKYMAFQVFCIPTGGTDDTENDSPEFVAGSKPVQNQSKPPARPVDDAPGCPNPDCHTPGAVIKDRYNEGGYVCYRARGGCGAKF